MKIIDTIKESAIKYILSALFVCIGLLIGSLYSDLIPMILPIIIQEWPKILLLKILTVAILLCVLLSALSFAFYLKLKNKLIPKCGILWDKNKEPHCPACEKPLSHYHKAPANQFYEFACINCKQKIYLMHDGKPISLPEAQKLLKS